MTPHFESTDTEFETTRSARLRPMLPPSQRLSWGHVVHNSDPGVPDLLADDVDEETERFMMRAPTKRNTVPLCSSSSRHHHKKRHHHQHRSSVDSSTTRRRTQDAYESSGGVPHEEVLQWISDNIGCCNDSANTVDVSSRQQEQMLQQWNENQHHHNRTSMPPPPPKPLERQENRIRRDKVHPAMLQREALLDAPDVFHEKRPASKSNAKPAAARAFDTTTSSSAHRQAKPDKHGNAHGRHHAHASGSSAAMFHCAACDKRLMASRGTMLFFCTECGSPNPTEIK